MIHIKECHSNEFDLLYKIAIQTYNDTYQYLWLDKGKWYLEEVYKKEDFKNDFLLPDTFSFLVYDTDMPIGYFKLKNNVLNNSQKANCTEIDKLYLLKKYVGNGIGKTIMNFIIKHTQKQKHSTLLLKVMENSLAKEFYEKQGFVQTHKSYLDYSTMKKEYRSILTMIKMIDGTENLDVE